MRYKTFNAIAPLGPLVREAVNVSTGAALDVVRVVLHWLHENEICNFVSENFDLPFTTSGKKIR